MPERQLLAADHKEGRTVEIISNNLTKLADAAGKEYFSGFKGFFRGIRNRFYPSDTVKAIRDLKDLADRNLQEIQ